VLAGDHEPADPPDPAVADFFDAAGLLLCDMQYRDAEYEGSERLGTLALPRRGWGHASPRLLFPLLLKCRTAPAAVRVVHHDPCRSDEDLDRFGRDARELLGEVYKRPGAFDLSLAREGEVLRL
jgi:hypothetical protein